MPTTPTIAAAPTATPGRPGSTPRTSAAVAITAMIPNATLRRRAARKPASG